MCIYVFSPGKSLEIEYASEVITISRKQGKCNRPSTNLVIDLLIKNKTPKKIIDRLIKSQTPKSAIKEIYIIYPRSFYSIQAEEGSYKSLQVSAIKDVSRTFLDKGHPYNRFLNSSPCKLLLKENDPNNASNHPFSMVSRQPDLKNPDEYIEYEGFLQREASEFKPWKGLNSDHSYVLTNFAKSFTIFHINLDQSLCSGESRWMRWHVTELINSSTLKEKWQRLKDRILDRLTVSYDIVGPFDVREQLFDQISSFIHDEEIKSQKADQGLVDKAKILKFDLEKLLNKSVVTVKDWRINVLPIDNFWI